MCKFSVIFVIVSALILSGVTQAATIDVTSPGDTVKGVPDDGDWPAGEAPPFVIDNDAYTKFLNFKGGNETTGIQVTPSGPLSGMVVTGLAFTTGGDAPGRDPVTFELSGSNVGIDGPYTLIASGDVVDFSQASAWPRNTKNATPISFDNDVAYAHYQLLFTAVREPGEYMQISEVELLSTYDVPAGCIYRDIGTSGGYAMESAGTYTVAAYGHDIWGGNDGFGYLCRPMEGNGIMKVNLASMTITDNWAKVGVMIRETLADNSKHAMMATTGTQGCQLVFRADTGGDSGDITTTGQVPPKEMWIERDGDMLKGTFWNWIIQDVLGDWETVEATISMNPDVYIGLVVCSHNTGALCTAVFDSVIWPAAYNKPWLMSPEDGVIRLPSQPTLTWMPGDSATSHDVYLGPESTGMVLVDTLPVGTESYTPPDPLEEGTTYLWQIVEQPGDYAGPVFSFKTERFIGAGMIDYQIWFDIGGTAVSDLTSNPRYPDDPTVTGQIDVFDSGTDLGENYGARAIGYLAPETSGDYTFWIASDDASELWLSTSGKGCEAVMLCGVAGWSGYHAYDQNASSKSAPVYLEGGQMYPIWALWKEGGGGDHCSVAWEGPDAPSRTEIDGYFLMPGYVNLWASNPNATGTLTLLEVETLSFSPASGATEHQVLFGEAGSMAPYATLPAAETSVAVSVEIGKTYEWQVNEVFGTDVEEGCLWSFNVVEWNNKDIGTTGGSASYDEATDTWTITGDGADIWGTSDQFHYVYKKVNFNRGEGELIALVKSFPLGPNAWQKTGPMIRESLAANSKWIDQVITGGNGGGESFQWRDSTGGGCGGSHTHSGVAAPEWVKLVRVGNWYTGFHAEDVGGAPGEWQQEGGAHYHEQPELTYIGIAFTSHQDGSLITGQISNFSFNTPDMRQAYGPTPTNGADWQPINTNLNWNAGEGVIEQYLYFGDNYDDVLYGDAYVGALGPTVTEYDPGTLGLTKTYYWAVDTVVQEGRTYDIILGDVWSFTVEAYRLLDDFEAYDVMPKPLPLQELIPGELLVEAVPPPAQTMIDPGSTTPGYTIPGYTIEAVEPDGSKLVAHYEFEDNADDSTANANHGTVHGDPAYVTGVIGKAIACDATDDYNDYAIVADSASLSFGNDSFSIGCWIKSSWSGGDKEFIVKNGSAGSEFGGKPPDGPNSGKRYVLKFDGTFHFDIDDDSTKVQCQTDKSNIATGDWVQVTAVRDKGAGQMNIYADGVLVGSKGDGAGNIDSPGEIMSIAAAQKENGTYAGEIGHWFTGQLDDMRFYNYALSEGEARFLAGVGNKVVDPIVVDPIVVPPTYGPMLAHWTFDGDTLDSTDNSFDGTAMGDASIATDPDRGQVLALDGDGDYVDCGNPAALNFATGDWSLCAWIKNTMTGTGDDNKGSIITNGGDGGGGHRYGLVLTEQTEGKMTLVTDDDSTKVQAKSSTSVNNDVWHHVVGVREGDTIKLYIDGVLEASAGLPGGYDLSGTVQSNVLLGAISRASNGEIYKTYAGLLDDAQIYNCALTEGNARYLAGIGDLKIPDRYVPMLAHYEFEGDYTDSTGSSFDGTPMGDVSIIDDPEAGLVATFDGNGDAVDLGNNPLFNPGADDFSISVWINMSSYDGNWSNAIVGKRGEGGVGWQLRRLSNTHRISFTTRGGGDEDGWGPGGQDIPLNEWVHVAAVREGTQKCLYIDGQKEAVSDIGDYIQDCSHNVYIGARANGDNTGPEAFFNGMIDELRIFKCALTYPQVLGLLGFVPTNLITDTWSGLEGEQSILDLETVHWGNQAMRMEYDNTQYVYQGRASRDVPFGDFSAGGAKALSMWFRGDPGNNAELATMHVKLRDDSKFPATVYYNGDRSDLNIDEWQEWNVALSDFAGVNLESISDIEIGVIGLGETGNPGGQIFLDDMRLYPPRCVSMYGPLADFTGDCFVDMRDLQVLVGDWLDGDETGTGLVARYEFDGDLTDSSGNGNDGTAHGAVGFETDAGRGEVLSLPGGDEQYVSIPPVGLSGNDPTTIACWAKADNTSIPDWTLVFGFSTEGGGCGSHFNIGSIGGPGGVGAHAWCFEATIFTDDEALEWRHYAMTFDGTTITYYGDGDYVGQTDIDLSIRGDRVNVGKRNTQASSFPGKVDDARIYNRELSTAEINTVMSGAEVDPVYSPLVSVANLYDEEPVNSKKINFNDYAAMMQEWLVEKLWP